MADLFWRRLHRRIIIAPTAPWTMAGIGLVAVAIGALLAAATDPHDEAIVWVALSVEGLAGLWLVGRLIWLGFDDG